MVIDAIKRAKEYHICGILDGRLEKGKKVLGIEVIGGDSELPKLFKKGIKEAFICVGSIGDCTVRKNIYSNLKKIGFDLPIITHPSAVVGTDVKMEEGTFVAAGVIINPGTRIGRNAIINTSSSIDHDCIIGDFVHIAPGAVLSGGVRVGDETHIGTGAAVIQNINIGKKCLIGAGETLKNDLADGRKYITIIYSENEAIKHL